MIENKSDKIIENLEDEMGNKICEMLNSLQRNFNKQYNDKYTMLIHWSDIWVEVKEIQNPKDKASKEIEEVLNELNRIYAGKYKFDYTSEEK